ncbi:MAG: hypothetical protein PHW34_09150 [Hespellia sp.]|nr:hypothetical protein [Hespellia sp.]
MLQVTVSNIFAYLEYALEADGILLALSCYHRSAMSVTGICANVGLSNKGITLLDDGVVVGSYAGEMATESFQTRMLSGRETIHQGICIAGYVNQSYVFVRKEQWQEDMYAYFMNQYDLPLLKEWIPYLCKKAIEKKQIAEAKTKVIGQTGDFDGFAVLRCQLTVEELEKIVSYGLAKKDIYITKEEQRPLDFGNLDEYFQKYGHTIVENLEKLFRPLMPMKDKVEEVAFINKRLYPQQSAIVNGAMECLEQKNYSFLIESMGAGKTIQGAGTLEGYFNKKYLKQHPKITVKELYSNASLVSYRVIIMCPSHLVIKWKLSIEEEVPYARVEVLENLSQLTALRKRGRKPTGKEYYIVSKDSGKLSYAYSPIPYQKKLKRIKIPVCANCWEEMVGDTCKCGCREWNLDDTMDTESGLVCPECGELLLENGRNAYDSDNNHYRVMQPEDFAQQNTANRFCRCCKTVLWAPSCKPIDTRIMFDRKPGKKSKWKKISHFANRAKKGRKSVWVLPEGEAKYKKLNQVTDEEVEEMDIYGPRRFSMTRYIKKYLKNYFDLAVFDEVQEYKSGGSAQGFSMHDLIGASKKMLALTGTIAGGYASDLFYTLYRLDPVRMREKGYEYGSIGERKFIEKYGTLETVYEVDMNETHHSMSRGKAVTPKRCLPGISVLIFTEFLLDSALFLDLSDLSRYLPKLYEEVCVVPLEEEIREEYREVRNVLKEHMIEEDKLLMGSYLQFSLSYTDMPYGRPAILSPTTGDIVVEPLNMPELVENGKLLNKEAKLVELVNQELSEERNCFIYCEYTKKGPDCISYRLKDVVEKMCNLSDSQVTVLESSYPAAAKREEWMHQMAYEGTKVFITNAKCVATGLDFAFYYRGKRYNFPTIIFYQTGYDMIKIWQGSHRHYRLNQWQECRTFYLVSDYTIQPDVIELIATKEVATSSIQGQFSAEGLATMAKGVDPRVILAQAVAEKSEKKEQGLRKMMDILNERNNQGKEDVFYEKMLIFSELTGLEGVPMFEDPLSEFEMVSGQDIMELLGLGEEAAEDQFVDSFLVYEEETVQGTVQNTEIKNAITVDNPEVLQLQNTRLSELLDLIF